MSSPTLKECNGIFGACYVESMMVFHWTMLHFNVDLIVSIYT